MASLRERQNARQQQRQRNSSGQGYSGSGSSEGSKPSTSATAFPTPFHAQVDGEAVRVIAFGDLPGFSPAYLCVDEQGDSVWVSMQDCQIIDPNAKPIHQSLATSTR